MPLMNWKCIGPCVVLAAASGCCHTSKSANQQSRPPDSVFEIVTNGQLALKKMPPAGPAKREIEQLQLKKIQQAIDSGLMPLADPKTREKLVSIKSIIDRADRDGEVFLKNVDNLADFARASADLMLIIGTMYPDDLETQLHASSTLFATADSLENLRGIVEVGPDIARYANEAISFARRTVDRFPNAGRAYGQLAFVLTRTGGDKKESQRLFKRCIDMDSGAEFCKEGYHSLTQDGAE